MTTPRAMIVFNMFPTCRSVRLQADLSQCPPSGGPLGRLKPATTYKPSPRLSDDVNKGGFATFDDVERALDRTAELFRIRHGPFGVQAETSRQSGVVDVRVFDGRPDPCRRDAALVPVGHALNVHDLLMIGAVVVHDREQR